jgi:uncharacterized membrane protein YkoI
MFKRPTLMLALLIVMVCGSVGPTFAKSDGNGGSGNGNGNGNSQSRGASGKSKSGNAGQATVVGDTASIAAVKAGKAISLEKILASARGRLKGKIIDIRLLNWRDVLVYEVKGLGSDGVVDNKYFEARSGRPIDN